MHIAFFSDQHPATLGGLQVSLGLQRDFLEQAGHAVTVCAPDSKKQPSPQYARPHDVFLRSKQFGEHSFCLAGPLQDHAIDAAFGGLPAVDVVHIQADVWGAWLGYRFAYRHGLPVVHTMHTNIEVGLPAIVPFPRAALRFLLAAQERYLNTAHSRDIGGYVCAFAELADSVIVPTAHFAERVRHYGVDRELQVIPTGVDDRLICRAQSHSTPTAQRPSLLWLGRISDEKRLGDTLHALALSGLNADLHVYGSGSGVRQYQSLCRSLGIDSLVHFHGAVAHDQALTAMGAADVVLQSSLDYETQGLTVYEAISVGTPVLVRDPNIAAELPERWCHPVANDSIAAFARALKQIPGLLSEGKFANLDPAPTDFRQSQLTAQMIDLYQATILNKTLTEQNRYDLYAA